jgi:hypothetical protein
VAARGLHEWPPRATFAEEVTMLRSGWTLALAFTFALAGCAFRGPLDPGLTDDGGVGSGESAPGGKPGLGGKSELGGSGAGGQGGQIGGGPGGGGVAGGGISGTGGLGGNIGGGPADAGLTGGTGGRDAGKDLGPICGPVCDIFCPNGNVLDDHGCPTCRCKPPVCQPLTCKIFCANGFDTGPDGCLVCKCKPDACKVDECSGPRPGAPNIMCPDGSVGGPVCQRTDEGRCAWIFRACPEQPPACEKLGDQATCAKAPACQWLEPGCAEPKLPSAGCYPKSAIGCTIATDCPGGKTCVKRMINPCALPTATATAAIVAPPVGGCASCGVPIAICL